MVACRRVPSPVRRARRQQMGALRDALTQAGHSPSIVDTESPSRILEVLSSETALQLPQKSQRRIRDLAQSIRRLDDWDTSPTTTDAVQSACAEFAKLRKYLMTELLSQRLLGFYFLTQIECEGDDSGYVVCLRQVRHLPRALAALVSRGLPKPLGSAPNGPDPCLSFDREDFAMPVGTLPSPLIEHLMQTFSQLFTRIGLVNLPDSYVRELWERQSLNGSQDE